MVVSCHAVRVCLRRAAGLIMIEERDSHDSPIEHSICMRKSFLIFTSARQKLQVRWVSRHVSPAALPMLGRVNMVDPGAKGAGTFEGSLVNLRTPKGNIGVSYVS